MPKTEEQVIVVIIAVIMILLFLGILFLAMILFYSNKRKKMEMERKILVEEFEKQILQSKVEMQEQTFNFISQEIHDNVGQILSLAKVQLSILEAGNEFKPDLIRQIKDSTGKAMTELRDLARSLNTDRIQSFDIVRNVEEEIYRINKSGLANVLLEVDGDIPDIKDTHKLVLFRVLQESLQNIVKHARASQVKITMKQSTQHFQILIEDNGEGFNVDETLQTNSGLGLKNIQKRVALIGGTLSIQSSLKTGTLVLITVNHE